MVLDELAELLGSLTDADLTSVADQSVDSALLDLTLVVGYFAFVNRMADGLGVGLESRWDSAGTGSGPG